MNEWFCNRFSRGVSLDTEWGRWWSNWSVEFWMGANWFCILCRYTIDRHNLRTQDMCIGEMRGHLLGSIYK